MTDDGDFTTSTTSLHASWTASDPQSGIAGYEYAIGTTQGGTDVVSWTPVSTAYVTRTGLSLTSGDAYYFAVKAQNGAGTWGAVGTSDGIDCKPEQVVHVTTTGDDQNDGLTWGTAKESVQAGVDLAAAAQPKKEVWVAAGTYQPTSTITLASGVALYGGFAGTESVRMDRNWGDHVTTLDGASIGGAVVTCDSAGVGTLIDGFTITNGSSGGVYCANSSPTIAHNTITGNASAGYGGGVYCLSCQSLTIVDNVVLDNAAEYGAGMYVQTSSGTIANNTIVRNVAASNTGGIYCSYSPSLTIANSIIAHNTGWALRTDGQAPTLKRNCAFGNTDDENYWQYEDNISADPRLASDDVHIQPNSPCREAGDNSAVQSGSTDIDGGDRILGGTVDIGADESDGCVWYDLTLSGDNAAFLPSTATVYAAVRDPVNGNTPVQGCRVDFTAAGGELASLTPSGTIGSPPVTGYACTDSAGMVTVNVGSSAEGHATLTASIQQTCNGAVMRASRAKSIYFDSSDWRMFHKDLGLTGVTASSLSNNLTKKWRVTLAGDAGDYTQILWSSPVVANGVVYVGVNNLAGTLYAIDATTGAQVHSVNLGSPIYGTPCVSGGSVYVCTKQTSGLSGDGVLHVLNASTLAGQWTYSFGLGWEFRSSPTVYPAANTVVLGSYPSGYTYQGMYQGLHTVDLTTHLDRSGSPAGTRYVVDLTTPAIDTALGRAYASDDSCYVTAARCDTGQKVWEWASDETTPMYASPVLYDGHMFVGWNGQSVLRLKDVGSAAQYTGAYSTEAAVLSTAAAWDGRIYFGCMDGYVYCGDATLSPPRQVWRTQMGSAVVSSPAVSAPTGFVFAATLNGKVYALDPGGTETLLYDIRTQDNLQDATVRSSPAAALGKLYVVAGDENGRYLYCFGP